MLLHKIYRFSTDNVVVQSLKTTKIQWACFSYINFLDICNNYPLPAIKITINNCFVLGTNVLAFMRWSQRRKSATPILQCYGHRLLQWLL